MKRLVWMSFVFAAACSDSDVSGNYSAEITNRADGCSIGWNAGENSTASVTITQSGSDATLTVNGLAQFFITGQFGTNVFTGSVDGDSIDLTVQGTMKKTVQMCEYTFNGQIEATLDGDTLSGELRYRAATNGNADCGTRENCVSEQAFNATRAPAQ